MSILEKLAKFLLCLIIILCLVRSTAALISISQSIYHIRIMMYERHTGKKVSLPQWQKDLEMQL